MYTFVNIVITFVLFTNYREYLTNTFVNSTKQNQQNEFASIVKCTKVFFGCMCNYHRGVKLLNFL
jgi:hypothetical protein